MKISVAIPTHEMEDREFFLSRCLDSLWTQTFQDFDIVVTDNSEDDVVKDICEYYGSVKYYRNARKGMAQNTNEAINKSTGELIKILYMDDCLAHDEALQEIWDHFDGGWLVTGCEHVYQKDFRRYNAHTPSFNGIGTNQNTIGSPSVLTIKNEIPLLFDEKMTWLLDVDYYRRLHARYGLPRILKDINVCIGVGEHQMTYILGDGLKASEYDYIQHKYL